MNKKDNNVQIKTVNHKKAIIFNFITHVFLKSNKTNLKKEILSPLYYSLYGLNKYGFLESI